MKLLGTLLKNELKLSIRNMNMVIFAVTMPLIVLVVLVSFMEQNLPQTGRHTLLWNSPLAHYAVSPFVRAG